MEHKEHKKIFKAASLMGAMTFLSRIFGYIRDAVIAAFFGTGFLSDVFFVAFRITNLLRRLVGEGALTSSFVPIFTDVLKNKGKRAARELFSSAFWAFLVILIVLCFIGVFFSEELVKVMAPGFEAQEGKFELTVELTKFMFPYMIFIGLMALSMGALNSIRHFFAPAFSPIIFNITIIAFAMLGVSSMENPVMGLALGVLFGGFFQFILQIPFLAKNKLLPLFKFNLKDKDLQKVFLLMGPTVLGLGVYQLNIFVTMHFASKMGEGSVSYLYYASRLMELPLGVIAVSLTVASLPSFSALVSDNDKEGLKSSLNFSLSQASFVTMPATLGLLALAYPIIDVLFLRGEFNELSANETSYALLFYALGILPVAWARLITSLYYAYKDTKTPLKAAVWSLIANVILCVMLQEPLRHGGLALATTISSFVTLFLLLFYINKKHENIVDLAFIKSSGKHFLCSVLMAITVYSLYIKLPWADLAFYLRLSLLITYVLIGIIIYILLAKAFKVKELDVFKFIKSN